MQPKYTPSQNIDPTKAIYGEKSAGVLALQQSLNKQYSGLPGYVPLKEDSLYGPLTQAATKFQAPAPIQAPLNPYNPPNGINPVASSTPAALDIKATGNELKNLADTAGITKAGEANTKLLKDRMEELDRRRTEEIAQIRKEYESASLAQSERQKKDYAGQATNLITAGGGFLGTTGSQTGVLNSLRQTHEAEKTALELKSKLQAIEDSKKIEAGEFQKLADDYKKKLDEVNPELERLKKIEDEHKAYIENRKKSILESIPEDKRADWNDADLKTLEKVAPLYSNANVIGTDNGKGGKVLVTTNKTLDDFTLAELDELQKSNPNEYERLFNQKYKKKSSAI